jgi:hypothetical protein
MNGRDRSEGDEVWRLCHGVWRRSLNRPHGCDTLLCRLTRLVRRIPIRWIEAVLLGAFNLVR